MLERAGALSSEKHWTRQGAESNQAASFIVEAHGHTGIADLGAAAQLFEELKPLINPLVFRLCVCGGF